MPLVNSNDATVWASLYQQWTPDGTRQAGYERAVKGRILGNDHWALRDALGITAGQSIVLIGAGFGWVAEDWLAAGLGPIAAVDTSTWIQANKAANATVTILNANVQQNAGRNTIRGALGLSSQQRPTWVITEDVLPTLSNSECTSLATALRNFGTNVVHWITVGVRMWNNSAQWAGDARLNWKTLEDWKTLMAPDRVVQRGTSRVL